MMNVWIIPYVLFVLILVTILFITLHQQKEHFASAPSSSMACVYFTSDKVDHPWNNPSAWMDKCKTQDPEKLVGGVESLVNLGKVKSDAIPTANLQRIFLPIGISSSLRQEMTKGLFDVYPQQVFVKKGYTVTLVNADSTIRKTYATSTTLDNDDRNTFKNASVEVKEIVPETDVVSNSDLRDVVFPPKGKIKSKLNSTFCVTAKKNSTDVVTSECTPDYREQEWKRDEEGRIVSMANNTCLKVKDDNTIVQEACDRIPRQMWKTDTLHRLLAKNSSSMCLQPDGDNVVEGANLVMKDCKKDIVQHWIIEQ